MAHVRSQPSRPLPARPFIPPCLSLCLQSVDANIMLTYRSSCSSARDVHNPHPHHRVRDAFFHPAPSRSEDTSNRETTNHHRRRSKVGPRAHAQVQGERERHLFYRKDVEPGRLVPHPVLLGPVGRSRPEAVSWRDGLHSDHPEAVLLGCADREGEEVLHCHSCQDLREIHERQGSGIDRLRSTRTRSNSGKTTPSTTTAARRGHRPAKHFWDPSDQRPERTPSTPSAYFIANTPSTSPDKHELAGGQFRLHTITGGIATTRCKR